MMVESEAKELSEEVMLGAVMFAHRELPEGDRRDHQPRRAGRQGPVGARSASRTSRAAKQRLKDLIGKDLEAAYKLTNKSERQNAINDARTKAREALADLKDSDPAQYLGTLKLVKKLEADIVRGAILKDGRRIDGRDTRTVRPIEAMVGFLPRTHGSALFTRGETQSICTTTLGTKEVGADDRWPDRPQLRALHAALQLPALFGRRSGPLRRPGPPRGRARQAGVARPEGRAADA